VTPSRRSRRGDILNNPKFMQISYETYRDMVSLIFALDNVELEPDVLETKERLEKVIYSKMDAKKRREEYANNLKNKKV